MSWYNRESENGAREFGYCGGALIGAALHHFWGWIAVLVYAGVSLALALYWVWQGARKAALADFMQRHEK